MISQDHVRAQKILAEVMGALSLVEILGSVWLTIGTCGGTTSTVQIKLKTPPDAELADRVDHELGLLQRLRSATCGSAKPGTSIQQLARGEVLAIERF